MLILPPDQIVLDHVAAREPAIIGRAVDWANVNSGSRNADGLARVLALLEVEARNLPAEVVRIPTQASTTVTDDGAVRSEAHADALKITARPDAPIQVVLTGHYDTVFPAGSPFQNVTTRSDGALNGPGIADMKGGISVLLAALEAFETHPDRARVGWTVLLSPDEEIGSPASASLLAELGARGRDPGRRAQGQRQLPSDRHGQGGPCRPGLPRRGQCSRRRGHDRRPPARSEQPA
jgi:glutamate carboxypeptidase